MYRVKYLFGILSAFAGLLYLLFALVSMSTGQASVDSRMTFYLCIVHLVVALVMLTDSYRGHRREMVRLELTLNSLLQTQSSITPRELAEAASIPLAEAHEYLLNEAGRHRLKVIAKPENIVVRAFPPHALN